MRERRSRKKFRLVWGVVPAALLLTAGFIYMNQIHTQDVHAADQLEQPDIVSIAQSKEDHDSRPAPLPPEQAIVLSTATGSYPMPAGVQLERLHHVHIPAGSIFSFRAWYLQDDASNAELSLSAWAQPMSLLYKAAIKAGLEPVQRQISLTLPPYAAPGFEVSLAGSTNDLQMYNALPFDLWVAVSPLQDAISLLGQPDGSWQAPQIEIIEEKFEPETMLLQAAGDVERDLLGEPQEGLLVKVYRSRDSERTLLYKDFYAPVPQVELITPKNGEADIAQWTAQVFDFEVDEKIATGDQLETADEAEGLAESEP